MSASKKSFTKESKILLLGGSGYIGSHFFRFLTDQGFTNVWTGGRNSLGPNSLIIDLVNPSSVSLIKDGEFDFIFNFTGQVTNPIKKCLEINTLGIKNLIRSLGVSTKLIQLSSVGVYGSGDFADESTICNPETPYSTLKLVAEELLLDGLNHENLLILRLSNIYGSSQPKGIFAYLQRSGKSDQILDFNNDGSLFRFFLHVEDLVRALFLICRKNEWGKQVILNFVGRDKFAIPGLIDLFEKNLGFHYQRNFSPSKPYDNRMNISDQLFRKITGFEEKYNLESYIKELK
ncbi:MAG: NAD(P)-dependent oxidoreductase [Cyclobacteriaceae bacterium]|nr:NAD(P)-dependent oxidoreductase [Cyclobacteriaceae bacterium]MDX5465436.1 NAD(P)-dependent oxidoreductase [Cyclobacteriaceae bacterium]